MPGLASEPPFRPEFFDVASGVAISVASMVVPYFGIVQFGLFLPRCAWAGMEAPRAEINAGNDFLDVTHVAPPPPSRSR